MKYDLAVVIGRFQPFHEGHKPLIQTALEMSDHVLVLVGSAQQAPTIKNPFSFELVSSWIDKCAHSAGAYSNDKSFFVEKLADRLYDDNAWITAVHRKVDEALNYSFKSLGKANVCIVGHKKDNSSYYLDSFPTFDFVPAPETKLGGNVVHSTDIRNMMFEGNLPRYVDQGVFNDLLAWMRGQELDFGSTGYQEEYQVIKEEYEFIKKYKSQFESMPYPPVFVTADAVVMNRGHVLLVKRRSQPGKGLYALPGGFINQNERVVDAIFRELQEETGINVPQKLLRASLKKVEVFDAPDRSLRGRTITHAGLIVLDEVQLPRVKGSDDAEKALWVPMSKFFNGEMDFKMFEDHLSIITKLIYA